MSALGVSSGGPTIGPPNPWSWDAENGLCYNGQHRAPFHVVSELATKDAPAGLYQGLSPQQWWQAQACLWGFDDLLINPMKILSFRKIKNVRHSVANKISRQRTLTVSRRVQEIEASLRRQYEMEVVRNIQGNNVQNFLTKAPAFSSHPTTRNTREKAVSDGDNESSRKGCSKPEIKQKEFEQHMQIEPYELRARRTSTTAGPKTTSESRKRTVSQMDGGFRQNSQSVKLPRQTSRTTTSSRGAFVRSLGQSPSPNRCRSNNIRSRNIPPDYSSDHDTSDLDGVSDSSEWAEVLGRSERVTQPERPKFQIERLTTPRNGGREGLQNTDNAKAAFFESDARPQQASEHFEKVLPTTWLKPSQSPGRASSLGFSKSTYFTSTTTFTSSTSSIRTPAPIRQTSMPKPVFGEPAYHKVISGRGKCEHMKLNSGKPPSASEPATIPDDHQQNIDEADYDFLDVVDEYVNRQAAGVALP